jgi:hypothetical protein
MPGQFFLLESIVPLVSIRKLERILGVQRQDLTTLAEHAGQYYKSFDMRKIGKDKWRHIDNPIGELRKVQKRIYRRILKKYPIPGTMLGGVTKRSIIDNAKSHVRQSVIVILDIRNCFPSTSDLRIFDVYKRLFGCSTEIASVFTKLTTYQTRLPQGAPTSSALANFALLPIHDEIQKIASENAVCCTFFVDDITLSGRNAPLIIENIIKVIQKYGLSAPNGKKKIMRSGDTQQVTGLLVNKKPNISRSYVEKLRKDIIVASENGFISEQERLSIEGRAKFISRVNPNHSSRLQRLIDNVLPVVTGQIRDVKKFEYRDCKCAKRHRLKR